MFNKTENEKNSDSYKLCRKIARNADYLYDISNTSEYNSLCSHYRHWVYENIKKIIEKTKENDMISEANKFIDVRNCIMHTYRSYNCLFDFKQNELPKLENKLEEKHLYDYFSNFDTIKIDKTCKHVQIDKYKKYLTHISEIYKKHNKEYHCCNGSWQENCFSYFKCNSDFDPEKLLSKLNNVGKETCEELEKEKKPTSSDISTTSHGEESDIMSTFYTGPCKNIGEGRLICSLRQASYISPKVPHKPLKYIPEVKKDKRNENTLSQEDHSDDEHSSGTDSSHDTNQILHSINTGSYVFTSKNITLSQPQQMNIEINNPLNLAILKTQNKPVQTVEVKEGFKWKIGQGNISCTPNNSNTDKYNLCGYVKRLKEAQKSIKGLNIGDKLLENSMLSTYENIINSNQSESRNKGDYHINFYPDGQTLMSHDIYGSYDPLPEEHILNSNYVRIAMVAVLTFGIIFLFFIYYKVNEN
ncbi:hypothetical protein PVMG_06154 [Plasmodium vivax Mauritania I]|uniref:Uncharacterized protein n=1 Tax=Plasmodium vivax Mauritania I TaxID=1035515 RepID=A0A0J9W5M2_PLAVI|nr:hypothetical protein PVMG_06154 [Plasmodium vivax Mauritania I]